ncbi:MAG: hypothetical protein IE916_06750 [Epsilonproteobacteria bacterium]|nr:hypothetical protein [Campylobacterota bacterium]
MTYRIALYLLLGLDAIVLFWQTNQLSISYHEAVIFFDQKGFLHHLVNFSTHILGLNDFALRLPMILMHIASALLLYAIAAFYIKTDRERLWLVGVFLFLPGLFSSALLVDKAGVIIFFTFLFVLLYEKGHIKSSYLLLLLMLFLENGFIYLYFSLIFYAIYKGERYFSIYAFLLMVGAYYFYGIDTSGLPRGHFLDAIGLYATVYTPIIFIYLVYVLYRKALLREFTLPWFIASSVLLLSLALSFRQPLNIEDFAPYLAVALPLAAATFIGSYRVRLREFRGNYRVLFTIAVSFLAINLAVMLLHKELYHILSRPSYHFAYKLHIAKELSEELHKRGISCINTDREMQKRLRFYGVSKCDTHFIKPYKKNNCEGSSVTIRYSKVPIYKVCVTKINNN